MIKLKITLMNMTNGYDDVDNGNDDGDFQGNGSVDKLSSVDKFELFQGFDFYHKNVIETFLESLHLNLQNKNKISVSSSSSSAALAWDTHQKLIHPYFVNGTTSSV